MVGKRESWQLSIMTVVSNNNNVKDNSQHGTLAMGQAAFYVFTVCLSSHLISTVLKGVLFYFSTDSYLRGTARLGNLPGGTLLEVMKKTEFEYRKSGSRAFIEFNPSIKGEIGLPSCRWGDVLRYTRVWYP